MDPNQGSGVMFNTLPVLFDKMPGGMLFGSLFFLLLSIAALTSTISILEVPVAFFIDEKKWNRQKTAVGVGVVALLIGVPAALSNGAVPFFTELPLIKMSFLGLWDLIWGNLSLSVGAFFIALFVGYIWKTSNALKEIGEGAPRFKAAKIWAVVIKYVAPVLILAILLGIILQ
jgi:NSS family neurotransmitter:Na+ symporter